MLVPMPGAHARVLQLSEADRDVNIFRNRIEEEKDFVMKEGQSPGSRG